MTTIKKLTAKYSAVCSSIHTKFMSTIHNNGNLALLLIGAGLLTLGLSGVASAADSGWDDEYIRGAVAKIFCLVEGAFGALIMVVSGLAAIVAAAMGAYRGAMGCLVIAVGAFILRSIVSLFYGSDITEGASCSDSLDGRDNG